MHIKDKTLLHQSKLTEKTGLSNQTHIKQISPFHLCKPQTFLSFLILLFLNPASFIFKTSKAGFEHLLQGLLLTYQYKPSFFY